jgi:hypothetical protein
MKRATFLFLAMTTVFVGQNLAQQPLAAEQITKDNAARRLFSGSDAVGGIGDWYLSNGIVEAVIDNAALGKDVAVPQQNGIAPTGGTLIDFALVGKNNDQFNQMFQIANLSPTNSFFYLGVTGEVKDNIATVTAGQETKLDFALERVIDTKGYVSADFHVHSARSNDTSLPLEDRVGSYVTENVEVIVSTDHNYITDFAPVLRKMAVDSLTKSIVGEEITTNLPNPVFPDGFGHHNVFPLPVMPFEPRRGAVNSEYVPAATFYDRANLLSPGVKKVFQLNHARAGIMGTGGLVTGGVFTTVKFDPTKPITTNPQLLLGSQLGTTTRNIDFNAIELYNGDSIGLFQVLRNDWISLINQGFFRTGTAVSDSHRLVIDAPGFPRSYVAVPTEDISVLKDEMITESVIAGNVMGTSGPYIQFDIEGKPMGSLVDKRKGF